MSPCKSLFLQDKTISCETGGNRNQASSCLSWLSISYRSSATGSFGIKQKDRVFCLQLHFTVVLSKNILCEKCQLLGKAVCFPGLSRILGGWSSIPNCIPTVFWAHRSPCLLGKMVAEALSGSLPPTQTSQAGRVFLSNCEDRAVRVRDKRGECSGTIQILCKCKLWDDTTMQIWNISDLETI